MLSVRQADTVKPSQPPRCTVRRASTQTAVGRTPPLPPQSPPQQKAPAAFTPTPPTDAPLSPPVPHAPSSYRPPKTFPRTLQDWTLSKLKSPGRPLPEQDQQRSLRRDSKCSDVVQFCVSFLLSVFLVS